MFGISVGVLIFIFFLLNTTRIFDIMVCPAKKLFVSKKVSLLNNHCLFIILLTLYIECS